MYYLKKEISIAGAHQLKLSYPSGCNNLHGHNWKITVFCKSEQLDKNGMVIDFKKIKEIVNELDHAVINDFVEQPTAENIAKYLCEKIPFCYRISIFETDTSEVIYEV